jgi:hypothetical protein
MRVKSPAGLAGAGGTVASGGGAEFEKLGAGGGEVGVENTGDGAGGGVGGANGAGAGLGVGAAVGFSVSAPNICVKLPGEDGAAGGAALVTGDGGAGGAGAGAGAGCSFSAPNICVKLPGEDGALETAGGGVGGGGGGDVNAGAGAAAGFSLSAPNICVKLPGEDGAAGGAALGAGGGVDGVATAGAGASGLGSGAPCFRSEARRSSSSRGRVDETVPNMPVALDELPLPDPPDPGASGLSKGAQGASIRVHLAIEFDRIVPDSQTTSAWLDSKGQAAYDASKLGGSEVGALKLKKRRGEIPRFHRGSDSRSERHTHDGDEPGSTRIPAHEWVRELALHLGHS